MGQRYLPPAPSCATCRFFALDRAPAEGGACRRYAPRPAEGPVSAAAVWPNVLSSDFCGDYALDHMCHRDLAIGESRA